MKLAVRSLCHSRLAAHPAFQSLAEPACHSMRCAGLGKQPESAGRPRATSPSPSFAAVPPATAQAQGIARDGTMETSSGFDWATSTIQREKA